MSVRETEFDSIDDPIDTDDPTGDDGKWPQYTRRVRMDQYDSAVLDVAVGSTSDSMKLTQGGEVLVAPTTPEVLGKKSATQSKMAELWLVTRKEIRIFHLLRIHRQVR